MRVLALASVLCLSGCAGGGRSWVTEAPRLHADAPSAGDASRKAWAPSLDDDTEPAPLPRRPVITLGQRVDEIEVPAAAAGPAATNVVVNVNVTAPTWGYGGSTLGYGYAGYGYPGWGYPGLGRPGSPAGGGDRPGHDRPLDGADRPRPEPSGPPPTPPMAGDWPAPPSYGPPPISHTVPGNPWR